MMAGNFMAMPALSLAAWLAQKKNLQIGEKTEITLEVSGAEELVRCEMKREAEHRFLGRVANASSRQSKREHLRWTAKELS